MPSRQLRHNFHPPSCIPRRNRYTLSRVARQALGRTALAASAALHTWRAAVALAGVAQDFEDVRGRVAQLGRLVGEEGRIHAMGGSRSRVVGGAYIRGGSRSWGGESV